MTGRRIVGNLRREGEQRLGVERRTGDRQHQVGGARPERRQDDAGLSAQLSIHGGGNSRVGLVAHQDEVHARAPQLIHQHKHFASGQSEDA